MPSTTNSSSARRDRSRAWETLYGIHDMDVNPAKSAIPGTTPPAGLPTFMRDGSILPPTPED